MKKILAGTLILVAELFMLSTSSVMAQEPCNGNFDCDQDVDSTDVAEFLVHFGRSQFNNPCPLCQDSLCPCSSTVPKTGQTTSYATGDDGDLEKGLIWPNPRFTDNGDGTVTDNLTNLIWLKNADCFGARTWNLALSDSNGTQSGFCGLTDGSSAGDWRLPHRFELESLLDLGCYGTSIPDTAGSGCLLDESPRLFTDVYQHVSYWTSTSSPGNSFYAYDLIFNGGLVDILPKTSQAYVWPVRDR